MTLLLITAMLIGAPKPPQEPAPSGEAYDAHARELRSLVRLVQRGRVKAVLSRLEKGAPLPEPYATFALAGALTLPLAPTQKRRILEARLPFVKSLLGGGPLAPRALAKWLTEDPCSMEKRMEIAREVAALANPRGRLLVYETLWKSFPGHPRGLSYLNAARKAATSSESRRRADLDRFMLHYHPEALSPKVRARLLGAIPCQRRSGLIEPLFDRGRLELVPEFLGTCSLPLMKARLLLQRGEYAAAMTLLATQKSSAQVDRLTARARVHVVPPAREAALLLARWRAGKSMKLLRSTVKTFLLASRYQEVRDLLAKEPTSGNYLEFVKGYSAYRTGRAREALNIWKASLQTTWGRDREKLLYWIQKLQGDRYTKTVASRKPVRSFYMRLATVLGGQPGPHPAPLPLFIASAVPGAWQLRQSIPRLRGNRPLAVALSLVAEGLGDLAGECLYRGLSAASKRSRRQRADLWRCWELSEGQPQKCKPVDLPTVKGTLGTQLQSRLALSFDWPHLAPRWGEYLPRPYLETVKASARRHGVPAALLYGIMLSESHFEPNIVSRAAALGLFQVIPPTGTEIAMDLGRKQFHTGELLDPSTAIEFGAAYLAKLSRIFQGNWPLAIAAYNAGPHQVKRWLRRGRAVAADEFLEEIPFGETRTYVKLVVGRWILYARELGETAPIWPARFAPWKEPT